MDANTTAAVDILIRTQMGSANSEFNRVLNQMKADAQRWAAEMKKIFGSVGGGFGFGGGGKGDPVAQKAMNDIRQMQKERFRLEQDLTRQLAKEAEAQRTARTNAFKASMNDIERQAVTASNKAANQVQSGRGFFSASFWGTLAGNIVSGFINKLAAIPHMLTDFLKDSFEKALNLDSQIRALAQFEGSIDKANDRVTKLIEVANRTPGLRFDSAVQGQLRLEAVGFQAEKATGLLEGLAKVRVLSNTSQTDFDIMVTELAKFAAGGEKVGVIFRELANHMPYLIQVITKEFGHLNKETIEKAGGPQKFLERLIDLMAKINPSFNSASLAVENVSDAWDRWKISIGRVIEQNPEVIAALNTFTDVINENTTALNKNESQTRKTASSWVSELAKASISAVNFADKTVAAFQEMGNAVGLAMAMVVQGFKAGITGIGVLINNGLIKPLNAALSLLSAMPAAGIMGLPSIPPGYQVPEIKGAAPEDYYAELRGQQSLMNQMLRVNPNGPYAKASQDAEKRWQDFYRHLEEIRNAPKGSGLPNTRGLTDITGDLESEAAKKAKKVFQPSGDAKVLIEAAARLGIKPLDLATIIAYETQGTFSPTIKGGAGGAYTGLVQFGPEEYTKYKVGQNRTFESQLLNSVVPFLEDRFAQVGKTTSGASLSDLYRTVLGGNPNVPLTRRDQNASIMQHLLRMTGTARTQALARFFGGSESNVKTVIGGIDIGDFAEEERKLQAKAMVEKLKSIGAPTAAQGVPGQTVTTRPTLDQNYIKNLRDTLGTEELITETVLQQRNAEAEISEEVQHYLALQSKALTQNAVDLEFVRKRNTELEAYVKLQQGYTEQINEQKDIERDLLVLREQNADATFVNQRRANEAAAERLDIEKEITRLQDEYTNVDVNQALRIQAALLKDIVDLRYKESDAIIARNKAILDIQEQTAYSADQANTKVLEFMASQKGATETMADFKIGLIESGYDLIDKGLDKILPKMGRFTSAIKDLAESFIKLFLNKGFRVLFGIDTQVNTGGASSGGGMGGIGGILQSLFGRAGGGSGGVAPSNISFGGFGQGTYGGAPQLGVLSQLTRAGGGNPFSAPSIRALLSGGSIGSSASDIVLSGAPTVAGGTGPFSVGLGGLATLGSGARQATGLKGLLSSQAFQTQLAGAMLGGALGAQFGGSSITGGVLGGVGGAIGGTLLTGLITSGSISGATTGGIFGSTAGLFGLSGAATFGIGLAIAGGLMLASYLFGRAKRRAQEKKQVNQLSGDALNQIQQLIDQVKAYKMDGKTAYDQGVQIRDSYQSQVAALKTSPGKKLAQEKLSQINAMLDTLRQEGDKADAARAAAQAIDEKLVPTFATGGYTGSGYSGARLVGVHANEVILNQSQVAAIGGYDRLRQAGVPGIGNAEAIAPRRPSIGSSSNIGNGINIYPIMVADEQTAEKMFQMVSPRGVAKKVRIAAHTGNDAGMIDTIETKLAGQ